ncbi:MAG: Gfo/Idh/MocA family oxidoreductase [Patescibacteria group bacterium]|jgi:predicted dehydrogenase
MNILIVGFGSIGQRHYKNLLMLGFKDIYIYDTDSAKINNKNFKVIKKFDKKSLEIFDIAFICNPNNKHINSAIKCAEAGCHLFIEKPLSHTLQDIDKLQKICQSKKLITMIGCNMRFHPCLKFIKNYLNKNKLGKIYSVHHEFGHYLPYWRVGQDYRKNYAVKKSTGGGIILDDIHEFDLLFWFNDFKKIKNSKFIYNKLSNLEIKTEDFCLAVFQFTNKIIGSVQCDYLQQNYTRNCKIIGVKGNLEWDFNENVVWLKNKQNEKKLFAVDNFNFNKVYLEEIKYFFSCISKKKETFNDTKIAYGVLKYCINR